MTQVNNNKTVWAHRFFFPAACLYAAIIVPLSVLAMTSGKGWPLALVGQGHAFEMLFGFALAVVAGYTLGPTEPRLLAALAGLWLLARAAQLLAPFSLLALLLSSLFGLALAWRIVPRFIAAKKWRNRLMMPLLGGLCLLPAGYWLAQQTSSALPPRLILHQAILFLALLMAFMGGRITAPAIAGELHKQGFNLVARVQPRVEGAFIILLLIASPALAINGQLTIVGMHITGNSIAGGSALLAGGLILYRLLRWQPWRCLNRPDLIGLCIGYLWLSIGLALFGIALISNWHLTSALHVITIGALGTLTSGVMSRTHYQRQQRTPPPTALIIALLTTLAVAVLARIAADFSSWQNTPALLWLAATAWTLCFGTLSTLFCTALKGVGDN